MKKRTLWVLLVLLAAAAILLWVLLPGSGSTPEEAGAPESGEAAGDPAAPGEGTGEPAEETAAGDLDAEESSAEGELPRDTILEEVVVTPGAETGSSELSEPEPEAEANIDPVTGIELEENELPISPP